MIAKKAEPPCTCISCCEAAILLTGIGSHRYVLQVIDEPDGAHRWRWTCPCGAAYGRWQYQSDHVAYHAWLRHAGLE